MYGLRHGIIQWTITRLVHQNFSTSPSFQTSVIQFGNGYSMRYVDVLDQVEFKVQIQVDDRVFGDIKYKIIQEVWFDVLNLTRPLKDLKKEKILWS